MAHQMQKTLPACVAALLAINAIASFADNDALASGPHPKTLPGPNSPPPVINCNNDGPGSLRSAVQSAVSGDTIDLTQLACSEITLTSGKIAITVPDLTLIGPGVGPEADHHLTIKGGWEHYYQDRVLEHGMGTLTISGLEIADAHYLGFLPRGGCLFSTGSVVIKDSIFSGCEVRPLYGSVAPAMGGAIYVQHQLTVQNSTISNNAAYSSANAAYGGGIFSGGIVTIEDSTFADNKVTAPQDYAIGGGIMIVGVDDVRISNSTISGNHAEIAGGARIDTLGTTEIANSTFSGNYAISAAAASFSHSTVTLRNSTVVRNSAYGYVAGISSDQVLTVQSSILADNRNVYDSTMDLYAPAVGGSANLITSASVDLPPGTRTECPRVTALRDHGGPTLTHALILGSPGIDVGNNTTPPLLTDQRGTPYPRTIGSSADIGAYEWQGELDNNIFKSAFEVLCDRYD